MVGIEDIGPDSDGRLGMDGRVAMVKELVKNCLPDETYFPLSDSFNHPGYVAITSNRHESPGAFGSFDAIIDTSHAEIRVNNPEIFDAMMRFGRFLESRKIIGDQVTILRNYRQA